MHAVTLSMRLFTERLAKACLLNKKEMKERGGRDTDILDVSQTTQKCYIEILLLW